MKFSFRHLIPAALVLVQACNSNEMSLVPVESGPVSISVTIDQGTRTFVSETNGAITFSEGDAIKIFNGTGVYLGITQSTESTGMFSMADGFTATGSGYAGFPAELVSSITSEGVTFVLPSTYKYSQVGGSKANSANVPCPMVGTFTGGGGISLMPACALLRFYLTDVAAGRIVFGFHSNVSGKVTVTTPSGADDGITSDGFDMDNRNQRAGLSITVTDVPEVEKGRYIYITIPVPTGTCPENISITNIPDDGTAFRVSTIAGVSSPLARATGHKFMEIPFTDLGGIPQGAFSAGPGKVIYFAPGNLMAHVMDYNSPVGTVDEWKFGEPTEIVGLEEGSGNYYLQTDDSRVIDKWVDLFIWQGASVSARNRAQGVVSTGCINVDYESYFGYYWDDVAETQFNYPGCWRTRNKNEYPATGDYIHISNGGHYDWRLLDPDEMDYIMFQREGAIVGGHSESRYAFIMIGEAECFLLFPDSDTEIWDTTTMGPVPNGLENDRDSYADYTYNYVYTESNWEAMQEAGMIVFPRTGIVNMGTLYSPDTFTTFYFTEPGPFFFLQIFNTSRIGVNADWGFPWGFACPVRLVRDAN